MRIKYTGDDQPLGCSIFFFFMWLWAVGSYMVNVYKLFSHCSWSQDGSYQEEIVHVIGLISVIGSLVTAWL